MISQFLNRLMFLIHIQQTQPVQRGVCTTLLNVLVRSYGAPSQLRQYKQRPHFYSRIDASSMVVGLDDHH